MEFNTQLTHIFQNHSLHLIHHLNLTFFLYEIFATFIYNLIR